MATLTWNEPDAILNAIGQYKQQYDQAVTAIANLDQQRAQLVKSTDTLVGAAGALEQLLKNREDELKAAGAELAKAMQPVLDAEVIDGQSACGDGLTLDAGVIEKASPQESPVAG